MRALYTTTNTSVNDENAIDHTNTLTGNDENAIYRWSCTTFRFTGLELSKSIKTTFYKGTNVQGGECLDSLKAAEETDDSTRQMQQASSPSVLAMPAEIILNQRSYNYTLLLLLATCKLTHTYIYIYVCQFARSQKQQKGIIITWK